MTLRARSGHQSAASESGVCQLRDESTAMAPTYLAVDGMRQYASVLEKLFEFPRFCAAISSRGAWGRSMNSQEVPRMEATDDEANQDEAKPGRAATGIAG